MIIYECGKIIYILWAQKYINYNVLLFIIYFFAVVILLYWNFLLQIASIYSVLLCIQMHEILDGPVKATLPPFYIHSISNSSIIHGVILNLKHEYYNLIKRSTMCM